MAKFISEKIKRKSAARLAAVQATYMLEYGELPVDVVIKDFVSGEIGRYMIDEVSDGYEIMEEQVEVEAMDAEYFTNLVRGVQSNKEELEKSLGAYLKEGWLFERFDGTLRALLLCAAYELAHETAVDGAVFVKEYVDLSYAFFSMGDPKMVNALLDGIAKDIRQK